MNRKIMKEEEMDEEKMEVSKRGGRRRKGEMRWMKERWQRRKTDKGEKMKRSRRRDEKVEKEEELVLVMVDEVFETLLNSHFIKHLKSNTLLSDHQYGFRKARSTGYLLSYLTYVWSSSLRNFGESFVIALDISMAFDRVWHKVLLAKLSACSFTPSFCKLIPSFSSNHFICCCRQWNLCILHGLQWCSSGFCPFTYSLSLSLSLSLFSL